MVTTSESFLYECLGDANLPEYVLPIEGALDNVFWANRSLDLSRLSSSSKILARALATAFRRFARFEPVCKLPIYDLAERIMYQSEVEQLSDRR